MDIGKAFSYVFEDEQWITKVLIGGLFVLASIVLIGIPFLLGYVVALIRNVMAGSERPLPEWDELGEKFTEGLILAIIFFVWSLPMILFDGFLGALIGILGTTASSNAGGLVAVLTFLIWVVSFLWGLVIALFTPAIMVQFAQKPEFSSGFAFADLWRFTADNIGNIIIAILIYWVAGIIAGLGVILCVVGVLFTSFWSYLVVGHLIGQVYLHRKGEPQPPAEVLP